MNQVNVTAKVASKFTFSHETMKEKFFLVELQVARLSGEIDTIKAHVSERIFDVSQDMTGKTVSIVGSYRNYNRQQPNGLKTVRFVFVNEIKEVSSGNENLIELEGFICKTPVNRYTKTRKITELLVATNRLNSKKSDYIPCICWGRTSDYASELKVGDHIGITGRIQSRSYVKNEQTITITEVSVISIEVLD